MSPLPIRKNSDNIPMINERIEETDVVAQGLVNIFPFLDQIFSLHANNAEEKKMIKSIWVNSKSLGDNVIKLDSSCDLNQVTALKSKGLLDGMGDTYRLTQKGSKTLRDAILNDEECSLTKKASKKMISKSSYDFGNHVLVKVNNPKKFGARYVSVSKKAFSKKNINPTQIEEYKIATKNSDGSEKTLKEYSDEELVHVLHLAQRVINKTHDIVVGGKTIQPVPVHKIKNFAGIILHELNSRK